MLLRPAIRQPDLTDILAPDLSRTVHLRLARDTDGRPVDSLHIHGHTSEEENAAAEKIVWHALSDTHTVVSTDYTTDEDFTGAAMVRSEFGGDDPLLAATCQRVHRQWWAVRNRAGSD